MMAEICIRGLKRFKCEKLTLAPLTILTGLNGAGKTSLLQAVFLARAASMTDDKTLPLNGPYGMELGTAGDVLNWNSEGPIAIDIRHDRGVAAWEFSVPTEDALFLAIAGKPVDPPTAFSKSPRGFTFLCAERLGPRGFSSTAQVPEDELQVGRQGEYCAHVLSVLGDRTAIYGERSHPLKGDVSDRLLKYEVEQWLSEISRPIEVRGERSPGSTVAELRYRRPGCEWVRSTNMGFGITYALPVVLGGLIAEVGGLFIVENPEAHLHPAGQSRMGVFLAWLAGNGVQVMVETHSDHIINGVRRAIAELGYLDAAKAAIHYFSGSENESDGEPEIMQLSISNQGSISSCPRGFFDQFQLDVASLGQIRRRRM